jgi:DNA processing protein
MATLDWLQLSLTDGLGPTLTARLVERAGSAEAAAQSSIALLRTVEGIGTARATKIHASLIASRDGAMRELERAAKIGARVVTLDDEEYPLLLRHVPAPPTLLYVMGRFESRDVYGVAIVGSRKCSVYGREVAEKFAAGIAGTGASVVSGGARGIDAAAHKGAMIPREGRTIAVLGSALDVPYPPEHVGLFAQIRERGGAVVSEFPMGTPPTPDNFPRRNRIISGLSRGTLVVEADVRSGALITARYAVEEHQRPVFAIPGRIDNPLSAGPHKLLKDGAILVERFGDLLDQLGPLPQSMYDAPATPRPSHGEPSDADLFSGTTEMPASAVAPAPAPEGPPVSAAQSKILDALKTNRTLHVDQLAEQTGMPVSDVLKELTLLSLRGHVKRVDGQTYAIRTR